VLTALRGAEHPAISSVVSAVSEMKLTAPASTASWAKAFVVAAGDDQHAAVGEPAPELCGQGDAVAVLEPYVGEDQLGAVALVEGDGVLGRRRGAYGVDAGAAEPFDEHVAHRRVSSTTRTRTAGVLADPGSGGRLVWRATSCSSLRAVAT